jgi:hypothetical protein
VSNGRTGPKRHGNFVRRNHPRRTDPIEGVHALDPQQRNSRSACTARRPAPLQQWTMLARGRLGSRPWVGPAPVRWTATEPDGDLLQVFFAPSPIRGWHATYPHAHRKISMIAPRATSCTSPWVGLQSMGIFARQAKTDKSTASTGGCCRNTANKLTRHSARQRQPTARAGQQRPKKIPSKKVVVSFSPSAHADAVASTSPGMQSNHRARRQSPAGGS